MRRPVIHKSLQCFATESSRQKPVQDLRTDLVVEGQGWRITKVTYLLSFLSQSKKTSKSEAQDTVTSKLESGSTVPGTGIGCK